MEILEIFLQIFGLHRERFIAISDLGSDLKSHVASKNTLCLSARRTKNLDKIILETI